MRPAVAASADMPTLDFSRYGREIVDWIAEYLLNIRRYPVSAQCRPGDLRTQLPASGPLQGESMRAILDDFERLILPAVTHWNHPGFHAYFAISASGPGILGEFLTAALDVNAMLWKSCPAATEVEQTTLAWVLDWLRLPSHWFGMILDSASTAALHAIIAARQKAEPESRTTGVSGRLTAYVSEQTHSSVEKAAIAAGIGHTNIRRIPVDEQFRMRPEALEEAIRRDLVNGRTPFFAVATIGTTSTTAIDPVVPIGQLCRERGIWLHVDATYGGPLGIVPEFRHVLTGAEFADSLVVNAHKWMMTPIDCTLFYTQHPSWLKQAFSLDAEYLRTDEADVVNYMDYGLALGRRFRALKLWFVLRYFGREGLASILREHVRLAVWLGNLIAQDDRFELVAPVTMGLVCFRLRKGDRATLDLITRLNASGRFFVSQTSLNGRLAIRVAIGNIRTQEDDMRELWSAISDGSR